MEDINLTSPAFTSGNTIPDRYTCSDAGISPPLNWEKIPGNAKSLTLIVDDPDAPRGIFTHWVLYDLPPTLNGLPENYTPGQNVRVGRNSSGNDRYGPPCPPFGETHHYYFRLYALDQNLEITAGATRDQVINAMHGHVLAETELIGLYGR